MKINAIIRERRLAQNLTQEQLASALGVTASAVNKWEKGASYPDITLLPPLARLLHTDLNTLLSFQEDLSREEIALFLNQVSETAHQEGFPAAYALAMEKLNEYPNCALLLLNLALLLDGALTLYPGDPAEENDYLGKIEALYARAAESGDPAIREQALAALTGKRMNRQDYTGAQALLDQISDDRLLSKKRLQASLLLQKGDLQEAARLTEEELLTTTNDLHCCLMTLMDIALKEERSEDAEYIAEVDQKAAKCFDLWAYNAYVGQFQLYTAQKNRKKQLKTVLALLRSLSQKWDLHASPLYRHLPQKPVEQGFGPKLQKLLFQSLAQDEDTRPLADAPEIHAIGQELGLVEEAKTHHPN